MEYLVQSHLHLSRGNLLRIRDAREMVIYVWSGGVWLTQEGDSADRFIGPGGWFRIASAGVTLVSALGQHGTVTLTSPYEAEFAERTRGWVHALRARIAKSWVGLFAPAARPTTAGL